MTIREEAAARAFADALAALTAGEVDVADVLAHLMADCAASAQADAVALLATDGNGDLSLLAASSHRAVELELWQLQRSEGPCIEVMSTGDALRVHGAEAMAGRWGATGQVLAEAGYTGVEAYPMRWRGTVVGGLNIFHRREVEPVDDAVQQAFADVATLVVVQSVTVTTDQVKARLHEAMVARNVVEQAKGVLAYRMDLDLDAAYDALLRRADQNGGALTQVALDVVAEASAEQGHS